MLRPYIITWAASVAAACIIGAAWIYTHPSPKMAQVNLRTLVDDEAKRLVSAITPNTPKEEQEKAIRSASMLGQKVDAAISQLSKECGCVIVNSGAIVAQPGNATTAAIPDMTVRVKELLLQM